MNKKGLTIILIISLIINTLLLALILLFVINPQFSISNNQKNSIAENKESRQAIAERYIKKLVCENLYYPDSYDPVFVRVDSAFYSPYLNIDCINAAKELKSLRVRYNYAESEYNRYKIHGEAFADERREQSRLMRDYSNKIKEQESIIINRDKTREGLFVGWAIDNRYRAKNNSGNILFGHQLYIVSKDFTEWFLRFEVGSDDENDYFKIKEIIDEVLNKK